MSRSKSETRDEEELLIKLAELYHERGVYLPTRTLYLGSEATEVDGGESGCDAKMAERFLKNLHILDSASPDPITVIMNNVGGDEYHGLAIYDAIKLSRCEVTIRARGHAMSMGSIILQAADRRVMSPLATQMVHYGTMGFSGHSKDMPKWADESERLNRWMENMYLERIRQLHPRYGLESLRELLRFDSFFDAMTSVGLGLADEVG